MITSFLVLLCAPQIASADSDGMFCQGEGYMAYELRHFDSSEAPKLYILKPSSGDDVVSVERHLIPEAIGQVHGLVCTNSSVLISAFKTAARFDLSGQSFALDQEPVISTAQGRLNKQAYPHMPPVVLLPSWSDDSYQYAFHQVNYMFPEKGNHDGLIEHHSINRIVRINKAGHYVDGSHTILEGMKIETID